MIDIILLEPVIPGNVGAVARVMKNFGFTRLVLVNPHCDHISAEARNRAKHSQDVLENAEVMEFFVVDAYDYLIATTARVGTDYNIPRSPLSPSELASKLSEIDRSKKIGLVVGREGKGMFNAEIERCDFVVTVPSSTEYPTLNISHAVAVMLYELHSTFSKATSTSHITPVGKQEKDQIMRMFENIFSSMRWETAEKRDTQQKLWKRIIGKSMLTKREAYGVMGFLRKVLQGRGRKSKLPVKTKAKTKKKSVPAKKSSKGSTPKKASQNVTSGRSAKAGSAGNAKQRKGKTANQSKRKATKSAGNTKPGKRRASRTAKR